MSRETLAAMIRNYMEYSPRAGGFRLARRGADSGPAASFSRRLAGCNSATERPDNKPCNSLQTNATLLDERWCETLKRTNFLVGVSLDGPQAIHDSCRLNRGGQGSWRRVMQSVELLQRNGVEFNILCVLSKANVRRAKDLYRFFRKLGVEHIQYIPVAEFQPGGAPQPWAVTAQEYGRFLAETFRLWWPNRRRLRIRFFDNLAEALAGLQPGSCSMHDSCDSYCVVEHNGDVYPCDFFVREEWKLGNVNDTSFDEIAPAYEALRVRGSQVPAARRVRGMRVRFDLPSGLSETPRGTPRPLRRPRLLLRSLQDGLSRRRSQTAQGS